MSKKCVEYLVDVCLSASARGKFNEYIRALELPNGWSSFQSIDHFKVWTFQDFYHFSLVAPFMLRLWLLGDGAIHPRVSRRFDPTRRNDRDAAKRIFEMFVALADSMSHLYAACCDQDAAARALLKFRQSYHNAGAHTRLPNFHGALHQRHSMRLFATVRNYDVNAMERKHKPSMNDGRHSNHKNMERDILLRDNIRCAERWLLQGGADHTPHLQPVGPQLKEVIQDRSLRFIMDDVNEKEQDNDNERKDDQKIEEQAEHGEV